MTLTELLKKRRQTEKEDIMEKKGTIDEKIMKMRSQTFKDYYQPNDFVPQPKYTATWQMLE